MHSSTSRVSRALIGGPGVREGSFESARWMFLISSTISCAGNDITVGVCGGLSLRISCCWGIPELCFWAIGKLC